MSTKAQSRRTTQARRRTKGAKSGVWLLGIVGVLLIVLGLAVIRNNQQKAQQVTVQADPLAVDQLLPLAEPVKPILGWHDMANLPDPSQPGRPVPAGQPQPNIDLPVAEFDFGTIPSGPDDVSQVFDIQNTGTEVLEVRNVTTSCGCTTAQLSSSVIPPGTRAELTAVFDPDYHDAEGPVTRIIWLETNDPDQPVVEIGFTANVRKN
jgi:hypothetical protein